MASLASTERFSDRVGDYVRYRPSYPKAVLETLIAEANLGSDSRIADIGSGTGISASLMLESGATVFGVEPNAAMRAAAEDRLAGEARFQSVDGTSEATTLPTESINLILCAQSFHWFDPEAFREECRRILAPGGLIALLWNERQSGGTPFLNGYEKVLQALGTDYSESSHRPKVESRDRIKGFFVGEFQTFLFENSQQLDLQGLLGRAFSSSYTPAEGTPERLMTELALRQLFTVTQKNGFVEMCYETQLYLGRV